MRDQVVLNLSQDAILKRFKTGFNGKVPNFVFTPREVREIANEQKDDE